jgi:uncharacterized protein YjbI with pentapeptide repeats
VFERCDLSGADLSAADLDGADLRGSRVESLRGAASLRGATVGATQLITLAPGFAAALGVRVEPDNSDL